MRTARLGWMRSLNISAVEINAQSDILSLRLFGLTLMAERVGRLEGAPFARLMETERAACFEGRQWTRRGFRLGAWEFTAQVVGKATAAV